MSRGSPIQERFVVYSDPEISESGEILDSGNREDTYSEDHPFDYDDPGDAAKAHADRLAAGGSETIVVKETWRLEEEDNSVYRVSPASGSKKSERRRAPRP